ncbi:MAG: hypothetical protein ACRD0U_11155 [Acidimicrobiales bacterium]
MTVNERISVPKAVRRTGVRGDEIIRAIFHGELSTVLDDHGVDTVDPEEVDDWAARAERPQWSVDSQPGDGQAT